jgi:ubiquinone/menaquinone biosynthesis C-methylase UbiE
MKTRESGMPPEEMWQSFFDPGVILKKLGLTEDHTCVVDFGCGFGTFAIPAAQLVKGTVHAFDIDPLMVDETVRKSNRTGLQNLNVVQRDFAELGCGLPDGRADYVMVFNLLHAVEARSILAEARRVLSQSGLLAVIHWNYDPSTPRGPSMEIRLRPEQCQALVESAGFVPSALIDLPPHHYGFTAR